MVDDCKEVSVVEPAHDVEVTLRSVDNHYGPPILTDVVKAGATWIREQPAP